VVVGVSDDDDDLRFKEAVRAQLAGDLPSASRIYVELLERRSDLVPALVNLAAIATSLGRPADAVELLERAVDLAPEHTNARCQLGLALARLGEHARADVAYAEALALDAHHLGALNNRALTLVAMMRHDEAFAHYRRALEVDPQCREAHQNLGAMLSKVGRLGDARAHLETAVKLSPDAPGPQVNLSQVLVKMGRAPDALPHLSRALATPLATAAWHSNLLLNLHYTEGPTREDVFRQHLAWARLRAPAPSGARPPIRASDTSRLRVGYVSPDFFSHAVAFFIESLLEHHDTSAFEVFAYASVAREDETTARLRTRVEHWRSVYGLSDADLADLIRADGIDILVDLAGHTADHRLGTFARTPAPIQITYLGYPDTTGLEALDFRITDERCDPAGSEPFHTEALLHMPRGMHCYRGPSDAPEPSPSPHMRLGHLTFGSFNNTSKLTERTIARWAIVLRAIPSARLLMKFPTLGDATTAQGYFAWFDQYGVKADRVTLRGRTFAHGAHLADHREVDVILDPFPYHGTTTTCEALWMGVPVLSLVGDRHVSRVGLSLLEQVGLKRFAAQNEASWIEAAVWLDSDEGRDELTALRGGLRERMRRSPLCDGPGKTRELEALYLEALRRVRHASSVSG